MGLAFGKLSEPCYNLMVLFALYALVLLVLLALFVVTLRNWKVGLYVFLTVVTFVDLVRRFFGGEVFFLLAIDVSILMLLFSFYAPVAFGRFRRLGSFRDVKPLLKFSLGMYVVTVIVGALNPNITNWLSTLAGLRSYLLAIPMIGIGWYVATTWQHRDYHLASMSVLIFITVSVLFAAIQLYLT